MSLPDVDSVPGMLIDGANRVGLRGGPASAMLFLAGATLAALVLTRSRARTTAALVGLGVSLAAWPGLRSLWDVRADGATRLAGTEAGIERLAASVESFARKTGCAEVAENTCVACEPVARFALAPFAGCASPARIVLREDAWSGTCVERGQELVCGTEGPRPPILSHVMATTGQPPTPLRAAPATVAAGPRRL